MINLVFLAPLVIGGIAGVFLREHQQNKRRLVLLDDDSSPNVKKLSDHTSKTGSKKMLRVDDVIEIKHYQQTSWTSLALSSCGALFYAPLYLASIPLVSYDAFYLLKTILRSEAYKRNPIMTLFEVVSVASSFMARRFILCSLLLVVSYAIRKMILQIGNLTHIALPKIFTPQFGKVWVLHDQLELEMDLNEVQTGDILVVHAGEIIAFNGVVIEGKGQVKQYTLQGTTQIFSKHHGDSVSAFSQLNSGCLHIRYSRS